MEKDINFLLERMRSNRPILLLGAGFSYGAVNGNGKKLPIGTELSHELYREFFVDKLVTGINETMLKDIAESKDNLRDICTYLRLSGNEKVRNSFLTDRFRNCHPDPNGCQSKLANYNWEYIFTLNIDDLVETIYRQAEIDLSVWDRSHRNGSKRNSTVNLIKLHGSVSEPDDGYVFDDEEYQNFSIDEDSLLKEFAHQSLQHDMVLVGTQFQEEDLQRILAIYEQCGYSKAPFYRFFILPSISSKLRLRLQADSNNIWVEGDTNTFLDLLDREIVVPSQQKDRLRERGAVFLDDISRNTPSPLDLYKGFETTYPDFFHNADILPEELSLWKEEVLSAKSHLLMTFFGESYIGKTCFLKRLLVELYNDGFIALQLNRLDDETFDLLKEYLTTFSKESNVAIFADNAAYHYQSFLRIKNECPSNIGKLILLLEDTTSNHEGKAYVLLDDPESIFHTISVRMNHNYAQAIYEKLSCKRRLNSYLKYRPRKAKPFSKLERESIIPRIEQENDIIDALYFATEGEPFQRHYDRWIKRHASDNEKNVLYSLCYLHRLGIASIPAPLLTRLGKLTQHGFRLRDFIKKYADVVDVYFGWVRLHRGRILNNLITTDDPHLILQTLREVARYCVPENEFQHHNGLKTIFERVLRVKRIDNAKFLSKDQIYQLFIDLEDTCCHISYFWVQYGIAAQINGQFEDANNHLLYAQSMRPNSYHVAHALAKNQLQWGLKLIKKGIGDGESRFLQGADEMYNIAQDKHFSNNYRYSVHTFVGMWLDYVHTTKVVMSRATGTKCSELLCGLLQKPLDNKLTELIKSFIRYCNDHDMDDLSSKLKAVYRLSERHHVEKEVYDLD